MSEYSTGWDSQQIYNLLTQEYKGESYLTFWVGNDAVGGHGAGFYYMLDKHYNLFKKVGAAGGLDGDLHDFRITDSGTALMTVYQVINVDLSELGKPFIGEIWDCLIQEVDIETGELVFQWKASEHYKLVDSFRPVGDDDGVIGRAFDWFHMNSIEKDHKGNYLTSSRYTHSLTYINGSDGEIIWILGGKRNMFEDLSEGKATNFAYQHDGCWADDHTTLTMFDNGVDDPHPDIADTRGLRIELDEEKMTAKLVAEYINPHNRTVLCDTHFGAESRFGASEPDVAIAENANGHWSFYVSWNGATEVKEWVLHGADDGEAGSWVDLERILKEGFETEFDINSAYPRCVRVLALESSFNILGVGGLLDLTKEKVIDSTNSTISESVNDIIRRRLGPYHP